MLCSLIESRLSPVVEIEFDKIKKSIILISHWENVQGSEGKIVCMVNNIESLNT